MGRQSRVLAIVGVATITLSMLAANCFAAVKLDVPAAVINYNSSTGNLTAASTALYPVTFNNNGALELFPYATLQLSTIGMDQVLATMTSRVWQGTTSAGQIQIASGGNSLLTGELTALSLNVVDETTGLIQGEGSIAVTGGSLAGYFGSDGILETGALALAFKLPVNFASSFIAIANTVLTASSPPGDTGAVPEASAICVWLGLIGMVGVASSIYSRKSAAKL